MPMPTDRPFVSSCGGNLEGPAGWFASPNFPDNYPNYSDCIWYITVQEYETILLEFREILLEISNGCVYDSISVYDGPSTSSTLLGIMCQNGSFTFQSSSNSLTVAFKSDNSVTAQGFLAQYQAVSSVQVECSAGYMKVMLETSYLSLLNYTVNDVYVNDPGCQPVATESYVVFNIPLDGCGTDRKAANNSIRYMNMVRAEPLGAVITRQTELQLRVGCEMQRDTVVRVVYLSREEETANVTSSGRYNISMAFYHSSDFMSTVEEFPYIVDLNQDLFIEAQLYSSDSNLVLFVDTCVASPSDFDFHSQTYTLIKNGCVRDGTYGTYNSPLGRARLHFSSFRFLHTYPSVYLQCKIVVCQAHDYSSRCYQGCQPRKRRDLSSSHEKVNVVLGPIQLRDQATGELLSKQEAPLDQSPSGQIPMMLSFMLLVATVLALAAVSLRLYRNQQKVYAGYKILKN